MWVKSSKTPFFQQCQITHQLLCTFARIVYAGKISFFDDYRDISMKGVLMSFSNNQVNGIKC